MKLKKWEIALAAGLIIAVIYGVWINSEQEKLSEKMIRLHIIANSDEDFDQELKLRVRDRVLAEAEALVRYETSVDAAAVLLADNIDVLNTAALDEVRKNGYDYPVDAEIGKTRFPTKEYELFSLPGGDYNALRITIGDGGGRNWWCVVFPPLCVAAASDDLDKAATSAGFSESDIALITETGAYELKFKSIEILDEIKHVFK